MTKTPVPRLPRTPKTLEKKLKPWSVWMRGYIHQEILLVPELKKFKYPDYVLHENEPFWLDENENPVTCPNYPEDIGAAFKMMNQLGTLRPTLFHDTNVLLKNCGGLGGLFMCDPVRAANWICQNLIEATEAMILKTKS